MKEIKTTCNCEEHDELKEENLDIESENEAKFDPAILEQLMAYKPKQNKTKSPYNFKKVKINRAIAKKSKQRNRKNK